MPFQIQAPFPHGPCAEDMAKKVKRSMTLSSLGSEAAQMDDEKVREAPNAERDLHRLFKKQGLSLPMPIRKIVHTFDDEDPLEFDHVNPSDWLSCLIDKYPCLLAGGEKPVEQQLIGFWELYRFIHPSHKVFEQHSTRLSNVWPLCFLEMREGDHDEVCTWKALSNVLWGWMKIYNHAIVLLIFQVCPYTGFHLCPPLLRVVPT